jgi:hypothetical protein
MQRHMLTLLVLSLALTVTAVTPQTSLSQDRPELIPISVEGQPVAENAKRLIQAMQFLGTPFPEKITKDLNAAIQAKDAIMIQQILDPQVLVAISMSPEARVKAARGPGKAALQQAGSPSRHQRPCLRPPSRHCPGSPRPSRRPRTRRRK